MSKISLKKPFWSQKAKLAFLILALAILLPGCQHPPKFSEPNPEYLNLLDIGPCWNGICPRQTDMQDAFDRLPTIAVGADLSQLSYIRSRNLVRVPLDPERFGSSRVLIGYIDRTALDIELTGFETNLTLSQIIDYFGDPPWILARATCGGDSAVPDYAFVIWYPEQGVSISTGGQRVNSPSTDLVPEPRLRIASVIYHEENMNPEQWIETYGHSYGAEPSDVSHLYPWPGWENPVPSYLDACGIW